MTAAREETAAQAARVAVPVVVGRRVRAGLRAGLVGGSAIVLSCQ